MGAADAHGTRAAGLSLAGTVAAILTIARLAALQLVVNKQLVGVGVKVSLRRAVASPCFGVARAGAVARGRRVALARAAADRVGIMGWLTRKETRGAVLHPVAGVALWTAPRVGTRARGDATGHRARARVVARAGFAPAPGQRSNAGATGQKEPDVAVDARARERVQRGPRGRVHHGKVHGNKGQPVVVGDVGAGGWHVAVMCGQVQVQGKW